MQNGDGSDVRGKLYRQTDAEMQREYVPRYPSGYVPRDDVSIRLFDSPKPSRRTPTPAVYALTQEKAADARAKANITNRDIRQTLPPKPPRVKAENVGFGEQVIALLLAHPEGLTRAQILKMTRSRDRQILPYTRYQPLGKFVVSRPSGKKDGSVVYSLLTDG
jgi:hypothetical protein